MSVPTPDYKAALLVWLATRSPVTSVVPAANIRGKIPASATSGRFITAVKSGGPGPHPYVPLSTARLDLRCYGSSEFDAMLIWRTVNAEINPPSRQFPTFVAAGCLVTNISVNAAPMELDDAGWPFVMTPILVQHSEAAA